MYNVVDLRQMLDKERGCNCVLDLQGNECGSLMVNVCLEIAIQ